MQKYSRYSWFFVGWCCLTPKGEVNKKLLGLKTCLTKVYRSTHITIEKWPRFYDLWCPKTLPLKGKANKKLLEGKNLFHKSWSEYLCYYKEVTSVFSKLASAALQGVRHCRWWASAPSTARLALILFIVLSIKMINLRTSKPKYRLFLTFKKHRPFFDYIFQVGPYTDFLSKYGPLYRHY